MKEARNQLDHSMKVRLRYTPWKISAGRNSCAAGWTTLTGSSSTSPRCREMSSTWPTSASASAARPLLATQRADSGSRNQA
jgi:hypothetical protein